MNVVVMVFKETTQQGASQWFHGWDTNDVVQPQFLCFISDLCLVSFPFFFFLSSFISCQIFTVIWQTRAKKCKYWRKGSFWFKFWIYWKSGEKSVDENKSSVNTAGKWQDAFLSISWFLWRDQKSLVCTVCVCMLVAVLFPVGELVNRLSDKDAWCSERSFSQGRNLPYGSSWTFP